MHFDLSDTIAAVASAAGGAVRGIVRISGPQAIACVTQCFAASNGQNVADIRRARCVDGLLQLGTPLGEVPCRLYLWPGTRSYTQQPSAELHTIGSPPIVNAALAAVCGFGARLAEPGEFTLRAFLAGRLDLTQAEAVLGVIDAGSRQELQVALAQLAGGIHAPLQTLRNQLLDLLAHLEAGLDFVEEDIEFITANELDAALAQIQTQLTTLAEQMQTRDTSPSAIRIALYGLPNAGKSSLLNALCGEEAALVSPVAGTTRDYVTRTVTIAGQICELIDTAGIGDVGEAAFSPGGMSQTRAQEVVDQAHVVLLCLDASQPRQAWEQAALQKADSRYLQVLTKSDLLATFPATTSAACHVSSRTGAGLANLREHIVALLANSISQETHVVSGTAARCRDSVRQAAEGVARAREIARLSLGEELVAAELRLALDELGRVTGAVYTDDVLDRIFSRFCIGK